MKREEGKEEDEISKRWEGEDVRRRNRRMKRRGGVSSLGAAGSAL